MRQPILWLSCGLTTLLLAGCGNKGPLYMPPPTPPAKPAPAKPKPAAPAPAATAAAPAQQH